MWLALRAHPALARETTTIARSARSLVAVALVACSPSAASRPPIEAAIPTPTAAATVVDEAPTSAPTTPPPPPVASGPKLPHGAWEEPDEPVPDDAASVSDICAIEPDACKPVSRDLLASCRCNRFRGRDMQKCVIDCVARERSKVNDELERLGP